MSHWRAALANLASRLAGKIDPRHLARASVQPAIPFRELRPRQNCSEPPMAQTRRMGKATRMGTPT
ncbi:MAG: hypothetical protein QOH31_2194 [Verrucomicrobiota bacterium]|jgi:hypothetical protein